MGKNKGKNKVLVFATFFIFVLFVSSLGLAATNYTTMEAWFGDIKIFNNNIEINLEDKPFISKGKTYIPVRALGEILNKEVEWTQSEYRIDLNDKVDHSKLHEQLIEKENTIDELEAKIKGLEEKLSESQPKDIDIADLENYVNDKHYTYKGVRFNIKLYENNKDLYVRIYIDKRDDYKWKLLTPTDIEDHIQNIVDDLKYNVGELQISGYILNEHTNKVVTDFVFNNNRILEVNTDDYKGIFDLDDMADYLNTYLSTYRNVDFHVKIMSEFDNIRVDVFVGDNEWFELGSHYREQYLQDVIYSEIKNEFPKDGVFGYILDNYYSDPYTNYVIQRFVFDYNGILYLE